MSTTYQEIIDRAQSRVDMAHSTFVSTDDWTEFVRDAYRKLYNLLVSKFQDYFLEPSSELTVDANGKVAVPADFQRLHAVDLKDSSSGTWTDGVWPASLSQRNTYRRPFGMLLRRHPLIRYRLIKRDVWFFPVERSPGKIVRLWYTPLPDKETTMSNDIPLEMEQWSEYLVLECCIMACLKEETDPSGFQSERAVILAMIEDEAMNRDLQLCDEVEDVRSGGSFYDEEADA